MSTITRARGDTHPIVVTLTEDGAAYDITGSSFVLTVSEYANPAAQPPVATMVGTIVDAPNGVVSFTPTEGQADAIGRMFYDMQQTDASGAVRTVLYGAYNVRQDITKNPVHLWTADGGAAVDGSEGVVLVMIDPTDTWEYTARGGVPVLRFAWTTEADEWRALIFNRWPNIDYTRNMRLSGRYYFDVPYTICTMTTNWARYDLASAVTVNLQVENEPGYRAMTVGSQMLDDVTQIPDWSSNRGASQPWTTPGWLWWVFDWDAATKTWTGRAWDVADGGVPLVTFTVGDFIGQMPPVPLYTAFRTFTASGVVEVAWVQLEVLP